MTLKLVPCTGDAVVDHLEAVAALRITVFRDFPYLYDGNMDYERHYLQTYAQTPECLIVLAFDGDRVVGASTAVPMKHETLEFRQPFHTHHYPIEQVFYCGESVLLPAYRGQGVGVRFFEEREAHARRLGGFRWSCFCAVDRPADHPRRPADYVPLDAFWAKRGYTRHPELTTTFVWKEVGEATESAKPMTFWLKPLAEASGTGEKGSS